MFLQAISPTRQSRRMCSGGVAITDSGMRAPATVATLLLFLEHTRHATHLRTSPCAGPLAKNASSPESRMAHSFSSSGPSVTCCLLVEDLPATLPKIPSPPPSPPHQHFPAPFFSLAPISTQRTTDVTFYYVIFLSCKGMDSQRGQGFRLCVHFSLPNTPRTGPGTECACECMEGREGSREGVEGSPNW